MIFVQFKNLKLVLVFMAFAIGSTTVAPRDAAAQNGANTSDYKAVHTFLKQHCYKCHGDKKQKADRRVDNLQFDLENEEAFGQWQDILDQLNLGDMPPASQPKPDAAEL